MKKIKSKDCKKIRSLLGKILDNCHPSATNCPKCIFHNKVYGNEVCSFLSFLTDIEEYAKKRNEVNKNG